jgi:hypothetical protein
MKIYENGVDIWIFPYEKLLGRSSWIPKENIEEVEILRYQTWQNIKDDGCLRWKKAPIELVIRMKDGSKRLTGSKLPFGIMKVAILMNEMWGTRIKDKGEGMGMAVPMVLERAKIGWWHRY